jgi:hypothetical protein
MISGGLLKTTFPNQENGISTAAKEHEDDDNKSKKGIEKNSNRHTN